MGRGKKRSTPPLGESFALQVRREGEMYVVTIPPLPLEGRGPTFADALAMIVQRGNDYYDDQYGKFLAFASGFAPAIAPPPSPTAMSADAFSIYTAAEYRRVFPDNRRKRRS